MVARLVTVVIVILNDSALKILVGELVIAGNIIVRQRGTKFHPGEGVGIGKDYTIFATRTGFVTFEKMRGRNGQKRISVYDTHEKSGKSLS